VRDVYEGIARGQLIRRALDKHIAIKNHNSRHSNPDNVPAGNSLEELALSAHALLYNKTTRATSRRMDSCKKNC
jgi:hypothetical protein